MGENEANVHTPRGTDHEGADEGEQGGDDTDSEYELPHHGLLDNSSLDMERGQAIGLRSGMVGMASDPDERDGDTEGTAVSTSAATGVV